MDNGNVTEELWVNNEEYCWGWMPAYLLLGTRGVVADNG